MIPHCALVIALAATLASAATYDVLINCIPISQCPELYGLAMKKRNSLETIKLLRHSHCGYSSNGQPMVWCSEVVPIECKTINGKKGICKDFNQCDAFNGLIANENDLVDIQSYIFHPQCVALNDRYVCCPIDEKSSNEIVTPPSTSKNALPNPDARECGLQDMSKIFGGKNTQFEEFPWAVQLQYQSENQKLTRNCGGTLISNRYVVTAAHCVDNAAVRSVGKLVSVILGEYDTRNETDCINVLGILSCADLPMVMPVESVVIHPSWDKKPPATIDHDIALIRLAEPVKFTQYIRPICLPSSTETIKDGDRLTVTGWGQTETDQASPVKLKAVVPVVNKVACANIYKKSKRLIVGLGKFCVGGEEGVDSCTGDSGGPLMRSSQRNGETVWYLTGVVSFGPNEPCGAKNFPGLYTYVPNYVEWLRTTIET